VVAAVVLAAGAATRFGAPKQALLLPFVLERLAGSSLDEIVVVAGAHPLELPAGSAARLVGCPEWERGPGASLRCGLAALGTDVEGAVIVLADGPRVDPRAVERLLARRSGGESLLAASYGGARGHPAYLARAGWSDVPDEGLRARRATLVPCDDLDAPGDVDTPADWPEPSP
jgi:CTP:molybdopterin cytidylyltransferase MocA